MMCIVEVVLISDKLSFIRTPVLWRNLLPQSLCVLEVG